MKNKQKKTRNPDPQSRGHWKKRVLHLFRLAGFALLFAVLLTLLYLMIIGIPKPLTRKITEGLQKKGIPVQVDLISLSARRGWVLHNVRMYSPVPDDLRPLLQTEKLYLTIWPEDWTPLSRARWRLSLKSRQTEVSLGLPWETSLDEGHPFRTISRFHAHLQIDPSGLVVENADINWGGYSVTADGRISFSGKQQQPHPAFYNTFRTYAPQVAATLAKLTFSSPPEISLHFNVPADAPDKAEANASLHATGFQRQGRLYEQITAEVSLRDNELQLDSLQIEQQNGRQLQIAGRYNLSTATAQLELDNTLPIHALLGLLPNASLGKIGSFGFQPSGLAEFTAVCGPCPPRKLMETLRVQVRNLPMIHPDVTLDPLRLDLVRDGSHVEVKDIQTQANGNPVDGHMEMDLDSRAWRFSAQGRVPTAPIGKRLGGIPQEWIDRLDFTNQFPDITVDVSSAGKKGTLSMRSTVSGRNLLCAGTPLDTIDFTMTYSNRVFALTPLRAAGGDQAFSGTIELDLDRRRASFRADSSFAPGTIARIIAPDHPTVLTNLTFAGPLTSRAAGWIDYSGGTDHAVTGSIQAKDISVGRFTADSFSSQIEARGRQLIFTNSTMELLGGSAGGSVVFDLQFNDASSPYQLDITANKVDLDALIQHSGTGNKSITTGRLSGTLNAFADAKAGFWASAEGTGRVQIQDGQLADLPVVGGFSKLIRSSLPGFSLFSLTTFDADYQLRNGSIYSDNVQLGGTLLSARARGSYSPQKGLDFTVRAEPLRQTRENKEWYQIQLWAADALKKGTAPLFDLLEFRLQGTLKNPTWRMKALPKEAYEFLGK